MVIDKLSRIEADLRLLVTEEAKKASFDKIKGELLRYLESVRRSNAHFETQLSAIIEDISKDCREFETSYRTYSGKREKELMTTFTKMKRQFALHIVKIRMLADRD